MTNEGDFMAEQDFSSDYLEGAHPQIMERLMATNLQKTAGYGFDEYSESARSKIRAACDCPDAGVTFLIGGTQANATVIDSILAPYQGIVAATSGHINTHESGAIERGGHKVIAIPQTMGKVEARDVAACFDAWAADGNCDHIVMPGALYLSQPTECGTLYSLDELQELSDTCHAHDAKLFVDGARLAYALGSPENDVELPDLARLCDVFTIGGTKCGALFGEAVVMPDPNLVPHFFPIVKQHGALLAKGRIAGIQFDTLFTDDLYRRIGQQADGLALRLRDALSEKGYEQPFASPTNQQYAVLENTQMERLAENVGFAYFEAAGPDRTIVRFATSWASTPEDVQALIDLL